MDGQIAAYRSPSLAADDFDFIARRMKHMAEPADYDMGGAAPCPGYRGPIVENVEDIGRRLRELEARKTHESMPVQAPASDTDWWCC